MQSQHSFCGSIVMTKKPYLLLDAGGTVVFPNQDVLIQLGKKNGIELTNEQLYWGYYQVIHQLDVPPKFPSNPWPMGYTRAVLDILGISGSNSCNLALDGNAWHQKKTLWTFTFPWVYEALSHLVNKGYRMSILSNSDGRTKQIFEELGLTQYFEHIFDSAELKCEKPSRLIFNIVLNELDIHPSEVLSIGDVYQNDILGANHAGIGGIHIDPFRFYKNFPGIHLENITLLENWLSRYIKRPEEFATELFPLSNKENKKYLSENSRTYSQDARSHLSEITQPR
jgi:putative hydrolase of the HAD superfamily